MTAGRGSGRFKRLTAEEARTLTREQLLDRIVVEQAWWFRRMDRGTASFSDPGYREFSRIMHAGLDPGAAVSSALRLVRDGVDDGYWDQAPTSPARADGEGRSC